MSTIASKPNCQDSSVDTQLEAQLPELLLALRQAYVLLVRRSAPEIAEAIGTLPAAEQAQVVAAFRVLAQASNNTRPLLDVLSGFEGAQEQRRKAVSPEPERIDFDKTVIFVKQSKVQLDQSKLGVTEAELLQRYTEENVDIQRVLSAHDAHLKSIAELQSVFAQAGARPKIVVFDQLRPDEIVKLVGDSQLVVSLGGDDHLKMVASHVDNQFFLGLNSDVLHSVGALTYFGQDKFGAILSKLRSGEFLIEEWTRLETNLKLWTLNGPSEIKCVRACSEVGVYDDRSRYTLRGGIELSSGQALHIKGSGILIAPGAGSTGWFSSTGKYIYPFGRKFLRTAPHAEYIMREPYGEPDGQARETGVLRPGAELVITSSSNRNPVVDIDAFTAYPFPRGSSATIKISETPLKVIAPL